jgi:hypothetical protein
MNRPKNQANWQRTEEISDERHDQENVNDGSVEDENTNEVSGPQQIDLPINHQRLQRSE